MGLVAGWFNPDDTLQEDGVNWRISPQAQKSAAEFACDIGISLRPSIVGVASTNQKGQTLTPRNQLLKQESDAAQSEVSGSLGPSSIRISTASGTMAWHKGLASH